MNKQRTVFIIGVAVVIGIVFFIVNKNDSIDRTKPVRTDVTVVAFGDSLVVGQGSTSGNDFVSLLAQRLGVPIINAGQSGDTTAGGLGRLQSEVLDKKPGIVIVLLGGNDALRRLPVAETFANLASMIDAIHSSGAQVLLLGVRGSLLGDAYEEQFEKLAKDKKVAYVPNVLDGLFGTTEYMSDTIHPNNKGYEKIADKVEPLLRKMLQ